MRPCTFKWVREKSTYAGFGWGKWFFSSIFVQFARPLPAREECNKYDLTASPCFWLANHNDQVICYS
jgi:hypothetical protein